MIFGAHVIVFSNDAPADRAFFRDVLGYPSVDAGHDWLIFALPPSELAVHPAEDGVGHELYLMCDDLHAKEPLSWKREFELRTSKRPGGVRSRRFSSQAEARWVSTNRDIRQRCRHDPKRDRCRADRLRKVEHIVGVVPAFDSLQAGEVRSVVGLRPVDQGGVDVVLV